MTINEFFDMINEEAVNRMELQRYADYVRQKSRLDKYLREEHLPILAVMRDKRLPGSGTIELGNETQDWDARINGTDLFEVVQALPEKEHEIRRSLVGDAKTTLEVSDPEPGEPTALPVTGVTAQMILQIQHANDHLQFPRVIVEAIEMKHAKKYKDRRTLIVAVDGDYTGESDVVIDAWLPIIRQGTKLGAFNEILLVEVARLKVFKVF